MWDLEKAAAQAVVWMICESFEEVCFVKPVTSRPANAERYLVAKQLRKQSELRLSKQEMLDNLLGFVEGDLDPKCALLKMLEETAGPGSKFHAFLSRSDIWLKDLQLKASEKIMLNLFSRTRYHS